MKRRKIDPNDNGGDSRGGSSVGRFFLLVLLAALVLYLLNAIGVPVVYRTDNTEILEHPHR